MIGFEQGHDTVGKVATFMICEWFLLKLAKDRLLGVDPPLSGQHVPSRVCYGKTCLLIRDVLEGFLARWTEEGNFVVTL
jgi:hypothetical protein